ncbi:CAMK/CAMKL protein kinase [Nematocida parisii ERTm1]|uniref:CAMK/CAMKL protein kinase n=1 Tax=Nematocida parisii (strain ERTm3) TaxID=935791 RepID=I3EHZ5_NEMP3|nr:CAMK/CAMKL protein kinase [Nematocida parisii ERTm1]EIJ88842.1 CAMK/CAMKL protein kinase [Nematocida parisii ERTm3]EIJ92748.1 CAMK/CAMKL protein kinase [Nematocida parisii ERTm1]|eukprot:XP_013060266.1 CAMK/CAMKL protein kinase [Nematocida parisii ERTm1]
MEGKRTQSMITLQGISNTAKVQEEDQIYFEIYSENGLVRSISSPVLITPTERPHERIPQNEPIKPDTPELFIRTRIIYIISHNKNSHLYLGVDTLTHKKLAIKIISTRSYENKVQARNETRILPILNHKNIIKYLGNREFLSVVIIYLEYFKSVDLFCLIKRNGILPVPLALKIFKSLVDTVKYMHSCRVCHLDIKPENILINGRLDIKIIDFGLSQKALKNGLIEAYGGSINYASPEAVRGGVYNGFLSDSWSCGVVLFIMVNGYFPISRRTPSLPHVPIKIISIIEQLLAVSPEERVPICSLNL